MMPFATIGLNLEINLLTEVRQRKKISYDNDVGGISEKVMTPYSSTLAWKIPWMEEPGRLQSMGSLRDGHD